VNLRALAYGVPLAVLPLDAFAWGLQTHLFFAQWVLLAVPFSDPELRAAVRRLPGLVLAGACLPDLALAGKALGTPAFRRSHLWATLRRVVAAPRDDADRALAVGYASHLVSDVVAHNVFVPDHEARILRLPHVTHALAEWAMDRHICGELFAAPIAVLQAERATLEDFVVRAFRCDTALARRAINLLARADGALRASPVPFLCARIIRVLDAHASARFDAYIAKALRSLRRMELALSGRLQDWVSAAPDGGNAIAIGR
jgi:hypothetical protein